ncbi:MAG: hypothetical protein HUU21_40105, partial [Polyangiaceae bacterium]|nr:hypothetical protein [Polyangiaceae bacterium]
MRFVFMRRFGANVSLAAGLLMSLSITACGSAGYYVDISTAGCTVLTGATSGGTGGTGG